MYKKFKALSDINPVVRMPDKIRKQKNCIITIEIITTAILDLLSFSIKGANLALASGLNTLAIIFVVLYFIKEVLESSITTILDNQKIQFTEQQDSYIIKNISTISNVTRGKVYKKDSDSFLRIMTNSETIQIMKDFIFYVWDFIKKLPITIVNVVNAILLIIGILVSESLQTTNFSIQMSTVLAISIVLFAIIYIFRMNIFNKYRNAKRELNKESEVLFNDIKNIEPLIQKEFSFRVELFVNKLKRIRHKDKSQNIRLNALQVFRTLLIAIFMISIIIIKVNYIGRIKNLSAMVITDILAVSSVYYQILNKIAGILDSIEAMNNILKDAESNQVDFENIMGVYNAETTRNIVKEQVLNKIYITPFEFSYPKSVYKLKNTHPISLEKGKSYLVYGHTGCGKSTFMHLLTGKLALDKSPIYYGDECNNAYLSSIMHESNGKLGSNPVLSEIIFNKDSSTLNIEKLIEVLKGTYIYFDIMHNLNLKKESDQKIIEYLSKTTIEEYSSGQKQRLAIVKVLYNLAPHHQIVVFDEATNALDDATACSVLNFMKEYCQRDISRIVFFVTHQVDITKKIIDGSITFDSTTVPIFEIKVTSE